MIKVTYSERQGRISKLEVKGHAGQAPQGEDIVCAGVSAVTLGGINALASEDGFDIRISEKKGDVLIEANRPTSEHDETVLRTIVTQLQGIAESYSDYVSLERTK